MKRKRIDLIWNAVRDALPQGDEFPGDLLVSKIAEAVEEALIENDRPKVSIDEDQTS